MKNSGNLFISDLSVQEQIDIDGGVPPTRDTSLANDIGWCIGTAAGSVVKFFSEL